MNASPSRMLIGAAAAFTVALFLFGSALLRAFSAGDVLLPPPASTAPPTGDTSGNADRGLNADALQLAVENDPFSPQRQPPAERYRLPGDVDPEPEAPPPLPPPPPAFRVTGTMVTPGGSYALIGVGDAVPRFLRVGEISLGYRLTDVTAATATMSNDERDIVLRVPAPPQRVAQAPPGRGGPQRGAQAPAARVQEAQQMAAMMRQIIESARRSGASPQQIEQIMRLVTDRGFVAIDNLEVGANSISITGRNASGGQMRTTSTSRPPVDTMRAPIRREQP